MDIKFMTPTEIWEKYEKEQTPLESSIISQEIKENIVISKQYFTATATTDGPVRVYCEFFYDSRWADKRPVLVIIPPLFKYDYRDIAMKMVDEGYFVSIIDYCGNFIGENKTAYPELFSFANFPSCNNNLTTIDGDAKHTVYYVWSYIVRRAISVIEQNNLADPNKIAIMGSGVGSQVAWVVAGIDKRVKALVAFNGGGYLWAEDKSKSNIPQTDEDSAFSSGIGAETYAKMISCPVLLIASSNSTYYDLDKTSLILNNVKSELKTFIISQGSDSQITTVAFESMIEWLRKDFLFGTDIPYTPSVRFSELEGKLYVNLSTTHKAIERSIYVSYGEPYSYARTWIKLDGLQKINVHEYSALIPVDDVNELIVAYATIKYDDNKVESTQVISTIPSKLNIEADITYEDQTERIFYDGSMGIGSFTATTHDAILDNDTLKVKEGPYGIKGISIEEGSLFLRHNANKLESVTKYGLLHFDAYAPEKKSIKLTMYSYPDKKPYYTFIDLEGGEFWQDVLLDCSDFKSIEGKPLLDFNDTKLFKIKNADNMIFNNFLWI